jgi:uncharacterized membrane protein
MANNPKGYLGKRILEFFRENPAIAVLYILSTVFFISQHSIATDWDFKSYSLNSGYLFSDGEYFEWYRAPLISIIIGIPTVFGIPFRAAEYIAILFISTLYLYASIRFSRAARINPSIFYALMLNPFAIMVGMDVGTEILTLSLLTLFTVEIFSKEKRGAARGGIFYGLSCLSRYTCLPYGIIALLSKDIKKIAVFSFFAALVIFPWLFFNYSQTGHMLTSIADSQALNVKYRGYMVGPFAFSDILAAGNILIIPAILGLRKSKWGKLDYAMALVFIITIFAYATTPYKTSRYIFNIILPLAYFSAVWLRESKLISKYQCKKIVPAASILLVALTSIYCIETMPRERNYDLGIDKGCALASNGWVHLNYAGYKSEPPPRIGEFEDYLSEGYRIVSFSSGEPEYMHNFTFLEKYPIIAKGQGYIISGYEDICRKDFRGDTTYLYRLNQTIFKLHREEMETNPCRSLELGVLCKFFPFL